VLERARLWRLTAPGGADRAGHTPPRDEPVIDPHTGSAELMASGMSAFDEGRSLLARRYYEAALDRVDVRLDARYFYAVTFYRERDWDGAIREFERLVATQPQSRWIAAAHWHIGKALHELGDDEHARMRFDYVIDRFPGDEPLVRLSREGLDAMETPGLLPAAWRTILRAFMRPTLAGDVSGISSGVRVARP
jgi:tetratricopeptide (TPR) repeat protein